MRQLALAAALIAAMTTTAHAQGADDPELIFKKTTVWRMLSPDAKLATYALDDPLVHRRGVPLHGAGDRRLEGLGGICRGALGDFAGLPPGGPDLVHRHLRAGRDMYRQRRSMFFKKMQIVRGCDAARNVLVYLVYSDRIIEGSPQNSTSTVPIMPWGDDPAPRCAEFLED
jgi:CreA protein